MNKIQALQNTVARIVLDKPKHSSATEALVQLGWENMKKRRSFHCMILIFKALNVLIDWDFNCCSFKDIHGYNTRSKDNICKPSSCHSWGQKRFIYNAWNTLPMKLGFCHLYKE